jgi:hypothetical protein
MQCDTLHGILAQEKNILQKLFDEIQKESGVWLVATGQC